MLHNAFIEFLHPQEARHVQGYFKYYATQFRKPGSAMMGTRYNKVSIFKNYPITELVLHSGKEQGPLCVVLRIDLR